MGEDENQALPSGFVTFVFTDIEGSTALLERLGSEEYGQALIRHRQIISEATRSRGGRVVSTPGDAMFLVFSDPTDAVVALHAAFLGLTRQTWPRGADLRVRAGMHAGEAIPHGEDYVAMAVHQAARIGAAANGGQILASAAVAEAVQGSLPPGSRLRHLGRFAVRDFPMPEPLFELHAPGMATEFPAPRTAAVVRGNLPVVRSSFIGRVPELAFLRSELMDKRLITLVGPGGVGKSRLSIELASGVVDSFPDGVWLVELAAIPDESGLVPAIAETLDISLPPQHDPLKTLAKEVAGRRMLLLLDNCEHVLDGASAIADVLTATPEVRVVATSRSPLGVPGEAVHRVTSLDDTDAAELFVERSHATAAGALDRQLVAQVVRQLDGIPLALELAAACTNSLGLPELAARLDDRFRLLRSEAKGRIEQHRTLRSLVDWSHDLLDEYERVLFRRLAVFSGGCTLELAEQVCAGELLAEDDIALHLGSLVDKSLVQMFPASTGNTRYTMLETLRMYAAERLVEAGEESEAQRRHLRAMVRFAEEMRRNLAGPEFSAAVRRCDEEYNNIHSALNWPLADDAARSDRLDLLVGVGSYWSYHQKTMAEIPLIKAIIEDSRDRDPEKVVKAKIALASQLMAVSEPATLLDFLNELAAEAADFPWCRIGVRAMRAWTLATCGDGTAAELEIEQVILETSVVDDPMLMPFVLAYSSNIYARTNKPELSIQRAEQAAQIATDLGGVRLAIVAQLGVGWGFLALGDTTASETASRRALDEAMMAGVPTWAATARLNLGHAERIQGRYDEAAVNYAEAYTLALLGGNRSELAEALEGLMGLCSRAGLPRHGAHLLGASDALRVNFIAVEPVLREAYDESTEALLSALGADRLDSLRTEGSYLSPDELLALVQETAEALRMDPVSE